MTDSARFDNSEIHDCGCSDRYHILLSEEQIKAIK